MSMYKVEISHPDTSRKTVKIYQSLDQFQKWIRRHQQFYLSLKLNYSIIGYEHKGSKWKRIK